MVSAREAGFNLRESCPLTRQALQNHDRLVVDNRVSERSGSGDYCHNAYRGWRRPFTSPKASSGKAGERMVTSVYPGDVRDTSERGMGCQANRHLRRRAESDHENVGGSAQNGKVSCPPRVGLSVGGFIVLGARESRVRGEGSQGGNVSQGSQSQSDEVRTCRKVKR